LIRSQGEAGLYIGWMLHNDAKAFATCRYQRTMPGSLAIGPDGRDRFTDEPEPFQRGFPEAGVPGAIKAEADLRIAYRFSIGALHPPAHAHRALQFEHVNRRQRRLIVDTPGVKLLHKTVLDNPDVEPAQITRRQGDG